MTNVGRVLEWTLCGTVGGTLRRAWCHRKGTAIGAQLTIDRTNTVLYCERWEETVAFYRSVLGLTVAFRNDWFVEFHLTSSSFLSIADAARATVDSVDGEGVTLTWRVPDLGDVRALLAAGGVEAGETRRRWGADVFYCHDPEGHRIEWWSDRM